MKQLTLNGESYRPGIHAGPAPVAVTNAPGALVQRRSEGPW